MPLMTIKSNLRDYDVNLLEAFEFRENLKTYSDCCFAIDENVWALYKTSLFEDIDRRDIIVVPISENLKNLGSVRILYDQLIQRAAKRNLTLVSIGGGILQDITGFVSSTLYRGINWIFTPTTLLAQADSCIGAKTSLNYGSFKNLIGSFYPPSRIIIHMPFLLTQKDIEFYSGIGEVIKLHIIGGMDKIDIIIDSLPFLLKRDMVHLQPRIIDSLLIKKEYIENDEFDLGKRAMLNFGHCFGHAIESTADFEVPHGQAILLGMVLANLVARRRGILSDAFYDLLLHRLLLPSLRVKMRNNYLDHVKIIDAMRKDKKRVGQGLPLVMIGNNCRMTKVNDLTEEEAIQSLSALGEILHLS